MSESIEKIDIVRVTIIVSGLLLIAPNLPTVMAANPELARFEFESDSSGLLLSFTITGLGGKPATVIVSGFATTELLHCISPNGQTIKEVEYPISESFQVSGTFKPRNGEISRVLTIPLPSNIPSASEVCQNANWTVELEAVTYTDIQLQVLQGGNEVLNVLFDPAQWCRCR